MVLNVIARPGRPVRRAATAARRQPRGPRGRQLRLVRRAVAVYRGAAGRRAWWSGCDEPDEDGRPCRLAVDLQRDFALNQPLVRLRAGRVRRCSTPSPRRYALDVVSVVEAILDDPRPVLLAQQFKARGEAVAAMKADGIEYEERMELLEEVT